MLLQEAQFPALDAADTNSITNALHAAFLLLYYLGAKRHHRRGSDGFTRLVVGLFLLLFVVKVLGVLVHRLPPSGLVDALWAAVAILSIALNDTVLRTAAATPSLRGATVVLSLACALAFALSHGDFLFLALPGLFVFTVTGLRSPGLRKVGFLMAAGSNLAWIAARKITEAIRGGQLPLELRYDNDLYHFLLIASTFIIYKGFVRSSNPITSTSGSSANQSPTACSTST